MILKAYLIGMNFSLKRKIVFPVARHWSPQILLVHVHFLEVGERCSVSPMNAHYVHGLEMGKVKFLILQGVGVYDNIPVGVNKLSYRQGPQEQDDRE